MDQSKRLTQQIKQHLTCFPILNFRQMKTLFIKYSILFLLIIGINSPSFSQTVDENFVRSQHIKVPVKTKVAITDLPEDNSAISIGYSDGLGRNIQLVSVGSSPGKKDLVQPIIYDVFGRNSKQYLPYTIHREEQGDFDYNAFINQSNFYEDAARIEHTNFPYSEVIYDGSPQNQVLESSAPGESWQIESINTVKSIVRANTLLDEVRVWKTVGEECISSNIYIAGDMIVNEVIDENGAKRFTYSDKMGKLILTRSEVSTGIYTEMYNVYDDFGNLTFVLPPNAMKKMNETGVYSSASITEDLIFQYIYNNRGLPIASKTPGAEWSHFIYDKQNRLILSQNGNLAAGNKWKYFKFDITGRPIIQGIYTVVEPSEELIISDALITGILDIDYPLFERRTESDFGYTNNAFPNSTIENQLYYYYDNYDFNGDGTNDHTYITPPLKLTSEEAYGDESGYSKGGLVGVVSVWNQLAERNRGKLTGMKTMVLDVDGPEQWLTTANFYSKYDRMIQIQSDNHLGGQDIFDSFYDFDGVLLKSLLKHEITGEDPISIFNQFEYDHAGRLVKVIQQNNSETPVVLNQNNYNELSQLIEKNQHGSIGGDDYLQSIDYSYNIRGFLTHINNLELESDRDAGGLVGGYSEELEAVELDRITIGVAVEQDRFGNRLANITLVAASKLIYEQQAGGASREINDQSSNSKIVQESSQNQNTFLALQSLSTPLIIEFSDLAISESHILDSVLILTEDRVITSLAGMGITDDDAIGTLVSLARDHVLRIGGKHYHNDDNNDLFGLEIKYQNPIDNGMSPTALFNGNISQVLWQSATDEVKRSYSYEYDRLNRLIDANYTAYDEVMGNWTKNTDRYTVSNIDYDHNGNILGLNRNGFNESEAYSSIDQLTYTYDGNRLKAVQDIVETGAYNDFSDGVSDLETEYTYDANGNMISDLNKGISIEYNQWDLPQTITFDSGKKIDYIYTSTGLKLKAIFQNIDLTTITRDYSGAFVYNEGELDFFSSTEGRVVPNGSEFNYEYHYKDHLGNLRLAYSDLNGDGEIDVASEVLQESHYYPYGMELKGLGDVQIGPEHQYKFNGKEVYEQFDLNWMDFGLRFYDASIGRWSAIDPVIKHNEGQYVGFADNPIWFVDPNGADTNVVSAIGGTLTLPDGVYHISNFYHGQNEHAFVGGVRGFVIDGTVYIAKFNEKDGSFLGYRDDENNVYTGEDIAEDLPFYFNSRTLTEEDRSLKWQVFYGEPRDSYSEWYRHEEASRVTQALIGLGVSRLQKLIKKGLKRMDDPVLAKRISAGLTLSGATQFSVYAQNSQQVIDTRDWYGVYYFSNFTSDGYAVSTGTSALYESPVGEAKTYFQLYFQGQPTGIMLERAILFGGPDIIDALYTPMYIEMPPMYLNDH